MEHHHKEISELGMVAYIEGLADLKPEQIDRACALALREVDRMPTVAHIRERTFEGVVISERPEYLDEAPISEEERTEALYFSEKLKANLAQIEEKQARPSSPVFSPVTSDAFNVNHDAYIQWLKDEETRDEAQRKEGLAPTPRSEQQKLAMFYNLPLQERNRLRWKAAWTKQLTKNT
jgi:hypothetical protein